MSNFSVILNDSFKVDSQKLTFYRALKLSPSHFRKIIPIYLPTVLHASLMSSDFKKMYIVVTEHLAEKKNRKDF